MGAPDWRAMTSTSAGRRRSQPAYVFDRSPGSLGEVTALSVTGLPRGRMVMGGRGEGGEREGGGDGAEIQHGSTLQRGS